MLTSLYSTNQCGYRDTFGLYILQINADTETRSGYIRGTQPPTLGNHAQRTVTQVNA